MLKYKHVHIYEQNILKRKLNQEKYIILVGRGGDTHESCKTD